MATEKKSGAACPNLKTTLVAAPAKRNAGARRSVWYFFFFPLGTRLPDLVE